MKNDSITLKKYVAEDFDGYHTLVREDHVMRYITGYGLSEHKAHKKFEEILKINQEEEHIGYFKILTHDQVIIGDGKLERYKHDRSKLEIGYILHEAFWGKGYGTAICQQLLAIADAIEPTTDIIGIIDPENTASRRLLEKFGFKSFFIGVEDDLPTEKLMLSRA